MNVRTLRRGSVALAFAIAMCWSPALATAAPGGPAVPHTVTWWCVDLNDLWNVNVPMIIGSGAATPPSPSPIPNPCTNPYPVAVPDGSAFAPGITVWFTNKTYPPAVRDALTEMGYNFHSQSPAEDFMSKFVEIRVQVMDPDGELVGEYRFDPRKNFRLVRAREYFGQVLSWLLGPIVHPDLGIDMPLAEVGRLPLLGFPVQVPPVPTGRPGLYRMWVYWTMSDWHNDGTCMDETCMLPAGEFLYTAPRFLVVP
jgi:hypothetical protein